VESAFEKNLITGLKQISYYFIIKANLLFFFKNNTSFSIESVFMVKALFCGDIIETDSWEYLLGRLREVQASNHGPFHVMIIAGATAMDKTFSAPRFLHFSHSNHCFLQK
jgi:hypothetical protein